MLGANSATVSPRPIPCAVSADASRRQRWSASRQLYRRSPCRTASRFGYTDALRTNLHGHAARGGTTYEAIVADRLRGCPAGRFADPFMDFA